MATNRLNGGVIGASVENSGQTAADTQTFNSDGTYTLPQAAVTSVDICVIGGAGGGAGQSGGGGGAGGIRQITGVPISGPVGITVGAGGNTGLSGGFTPGDDSIFNPGGSEGSTMYTATGGGKAGRNATDSGGPGGSGGGGSGGPGGPGAGSQGTGNTPPFSPPQGNPGAATPNGRGGGGGAGGSASGQSGGPNVEPTLFPGAPKCQGGAGGASGGNGGANSGQGGDGHSGGSPGGTGGSGVVRVTAPQQPFAFYGSGVWDMEAVFTYVKSGQWS